MDKKISLPYSYTICFSAYIIALAVAMLFVHYCYAITNPLLKIFAADLLATVVIYIGSLLYNNASMYDPYWSVVPPFMAFYWLHYFGKESSLTGILIMVGIGIWAIRLTLNWLRGWEGLGHQDWRYIMLRDKDPSLYWLTNFGGIHMFPTLMVFGGMLPVYYSAMQMGMNSGAIFFTGIAITIAAAVIELIADEQMRAFRKTAAKGQFITTGLWKYSRHPNYFGEVLFWFGLWVTLMGIAPQYWWAGIGWIAILVMFLTASIPMMKEKNLKSKKGYQQYVDTVSALVPWFPKTAKP